MNIKPLKIGEFAGENPINSRWKWALEFLWEILQER